jgi:3-oxoacyl-[acyl-carrier-protein] synthase II
VVDRRKALKLMGANIQFALGASREAWTESEREAKGPEGAEAGIVLGVRTRPTNFAEYVAVTQGSRSEQGEFCSRRFGEEGSGAIFPLSMLRSLPNLVTAQVSIQLGLHGFSDSLTSGDLSGLQAIGEGYRVICRGGAAVLLAGGADDLLDPVSLGRLLAEKHGLETLPVVSQGAAVMVLEERSAALARGVRVLGEVLSTAEGFGLQEDPEVLARSWETCLDRAACRPEEVAAIWVDATLEEQPEKLAKALEVFSRELSAPPVLLSESTRLGSMGAATGAVEAAFALMSLQHRQLPLVSRLQLPRSHSSPEPTSELREGQIALVSSASSLGGVVTVALAGEENP